LRRKYDKLKMGQEVAPMKKTLANPVTMMELGAPRLIQNDAELERRRLRL